ncbi:Glucocorticoid receptor DNA-binding factor 1 [Hyphodiscus hymeniophilus]|uniref:Glucocorticoid receptor DNA-binding factor 1 n=1 Tax=Hyphodiscus hymeniophilus TaxID=353542 RepID=A0A9P6VMT7_9HELO|nr:Glucocorticoid receptor DNA-binding factor 1 [Hyphodiscus hymeniophilus]
MARKSTPLPLNLAKPTTVDDDHDFLDSTRSPLSSKSPKSPRSPFKFISANKGVQPQAEQSMRVPETQQNRTTNIPPSQTFASLPTLQQLSAASTGEERQERERPTRSGFFSNYKASKSSSRLQPEDVAGKVSGDNISRDPDHSAMSGKVSPQEATRSDPTSDNFISRRPVGGPSKSDSSLASGEVPHSTTNSNTLKKNKPKPFSLLGRTKSIRDEQSPREAPLNNKLLEPERSQTYTSLKTAPLRSENDRSFRDMMGSSVRQRSEDRQPTQPREVPAGRDIKDNARATSSFSSSFREGGGHTFLTNLKSSATKGAGAIHKGLFGKGGRSGSTNEKEQPVDDEHYQIRVINLPLIQQTRMTRISKKLEESRDKTEFWMPAFPWRAIDYLNYKGSDVEGLYRVPGSGPQIKRWQRRFDEEYDIDLFEQDDLYDINIIGSMLKAWLRELPDELFPKSSQDKIAKEAAGSETVPQILIDELSNLPPSTTTYSSR